MKSTVWIILAVAVVITVRSSMYTVQEGTQALVTQFGEIRGEPVTKAGLHFKIPFIQDVRYFDKRILTWDGDPEQIPTRDKKYIWVDTTARWQIKNLRRFAESVQNERGAIERLNGILDGVTRDTISSHNLVEAVRNSNAILEARNARQKEQDEADSRKDPGELVEEIIEDEITGEIERVSKGREQLSKIIIDRTRTELEPLGIELIDVQLRRIAYERSVEDKVYERMISERNRIAEKIRSIGKGEEAVIRGKLNRDLKEIESTAYRKAQEIKGRAEAEATLIYAKSLNQDPEFYEFNRTLDLYRKSIGEKDTMILSTDSELFQLFDKRP